MARLRAERKISNFRFEISKKENARRGGLIGRAGLRVAVAWAKDSARKMPAGTPVLLVS